MLNRSAAKQYAYSLVAEGKFCFNQLCSIEKYKLTGLLLEATPKLHAYEYISDADAKCELPYMLAKHMETGDLELSWDIIKAMKDNAANMMANTIDKLLEEQEAEYKFNQQGDGA